MFSMTCLMRLPKIFSCCVLVMAGCPSQAQDVFNLLPLRALYASVDSFYVVQTGIRVTEIKQTRRYRWLAYLPSPGYSPFLGGFNFTINLAAPLQEIRLNHTIKQKVKFEELSSAAAAVELKNELTADYYALENQIVAHTEKTRLDSLESLAIQLVERKYQKNELTPTQYISEMKGHELFLVARRREKDQIKEAINALLLKAKMDVATNNAHFYFDHP